MVCVGYHRFYATTRLSHHIGEDQQIVLAEFDCCHVLTVSCSFLVNGSFKMGPEDVIKFCTECVLSEEGECDIPDGFYDSNELTP
jgi:hypothetical protein